MAFGYEYWIVYLPEFRPDSFLLFVHNPAGSTKLRDYSDGREHVLGQPVLQIVRQATDWGRTRFEETPHTVSGQDGEWYWKSRIAGYNDRYLGPLRKDAGCLKTASTLPARTVEMRRTGRAKRGSQRQLQDYVNLEPSLLNHAILSALPIKVQQHSPNIKWVSPLAAQQFCEFRDTEFLSALGLAEFSRQLNSFWPQFGPCWDALGVLTTSVEGSLPIAILLEAKSHVQEVYGNGCQAGKGSRALVEKSLNAAKKWCGAREDSDWTGPLYQFANRIAHLYFIRQRINRPCFLVNLYFVDDACRPTSRSDWADALGDVYRELGLTAPVPGLIEVFLQAMAVQDEPEGSPCRVQVDVEAPGEPGDEPAGERIPASPGSVSQAVSLNADRSFAAWCKRWELLGRFQGPVLPEPEERMRRVLELWQQDIPGRWQRGVDAQLLDCRYRRGDLRAPHAGEHAIEHQILVERFEKMRVLGDRLIDGVNAFPLACDFAGGGRSGNVEADMLLTIQSASAVRLVLCEVKADADDPWYAAVELLRQMRLFVSNPVGIAVMQKRGVVPAGAPYAPATGLVLAPVNYYCAHGKKRNAVAPAKRLFERMSQRFAIDTRLAVWEPACNSIHDL